METKQTSVDWLEDKIATYDFSQGMAQMRKYILQAKQMEKDQIVKAHNDGSLMAYTIPFNAPFIKGEEYYEENYGK